MDEEYYPIISLWIIGTYLHKLFKTYPYLYFNAMKGSGKTRTLSLLAHLSFNGKMMVDLTEAVLFRTAENTAFFIDELERISFKERANLRLLLNSAYKQGVTVRRMRKGKEEYLVDEFSVYTPIAMANIGGLNEVLQDRCITIILEKSFDPYITRMVEDWDADYSIREIRDAFKVLINQPELFFEAECSLCSVVTLKGIITTWNELLHLIKYNNNHTIHKQHKTTLTTPITKISTKEMLNYLPQLDFEKIGVELNDTTITFIKKLWECNLNGRDLEIFLPIIILSFSIDIETVDKIIKIAEKISEDRRMENVAENRDMALVGFLVGYIQKIPQNEYVKPSAIAKEFREDEGENWINSKWVGRAVKRLNFVIEKRRLARGIEITLNEKKIIEFAKKLGIDIEKAQEEGLKQQQEALNTLKSY